MILTRSTYSDIMDGLLCAAARSWPGVRGRAAQRRGVDEHAVGRVGWADDGTRLRNR